MGNVNLIEWAINTVFPTISPEMKSFGDEIRAGHNPAIPVRRENLVVIDHYGWVSGLEIARVTIPYGQLEKSYLVGHTPKGSFSVVKESISKISPDIRRIRFT